MKKSFWLFLCLILPIFPSIASEDILHIYTSRKASLLRPLFEDFTDLTGVKVEVLSSKAGVLIERLKQEQQNTKADLFLTTDISNIIAAKKEGLLQSFDPKEVSNQVAEYLRDSENQWLALSIRSRVFVYNPKKVNPSSLQTYDDLTKSEFKGKVCVRSAENAYNQALLASIIIHEGKKKALKWAKGVVANMARKPVGNDRDQIRAVSAGLCDIAIINTYYLGLMIDSDEQSDRQIGESVKIIFPMQNSRGSHVNVSAIGIVKYADNKKAAQQLIEFMSSDRAQSYYAKVNHEYPVRLNVQRSEIVKAWGDPIFDSIQVEKLAHYRKDVIEVFNQANWQ